MNKIVNFKILLIISNIFFQKVASSQDTTTQYLAAIDSLIQTTENFMATNNLKKADSCIKVAKEISVSRSLIQTKQYSDCLQLLGEISMRQHKLNIETENLFKEALVLRSHILGKSHPATIKTMQNIANLIFYMGKYDLAEKELLKIKYLQLSSGMGDRQEYVITLNLLGVVYKDSNKFSDAEWCFLESKNILERTHCQKLPIYTDALNNLAVLYKDMGEYSKALPYYSLALKSREEIMGKENSNYAASLNNFANFYMDIGDFENSERLHLEALTIREKVSGRVSLDVASSLHNLCNLYSLIRNFDKSIKLANEAIQIKEKILGNEHPSYAGSIYNLANTYITIKDYENAEKLTLKAKAIFAKKFGKIHNYHLMCIDQLAIIYRSQKNYRQAEQCHLEALAIVDSTGNKNTSQYASILSTIGAFYYAVDNPSKAIEFIENSIQIRKNIFGPTFTGLSDALYNLGNAYFDIGEYHKSLNCLEELMQIQKKRIKNGTYHLTETELNEYINSNQLYLNNIFTLCHRLSNKISEFNSLGYNSIIFYKGFLLENSNKIKRFASFDSIGINYFNELIFLRKQLGKEYSKALSARDSSLVNKLENTTEEIEKKLVVYSKSESLSLKDIGIGEISTYLKEDEISVDFLHFKITNKHPIDTFMYAAMVLSNNTNKSQFIPLCTQNELLELMTANSQDPRKLFNELYTFKGKPNKLFEFIWQPILKEFPNAKKIYYSPSSLLHKLNLKAIPIDNKNTISDQYQLIALGNTRHIKHKTNQEISNLNRSEVGASFFGAIEYDFDSTKADFYVAENVTSPLILDSEGTRNILRSFKFDSGAVKQNWYFLKWTDNEINNISTIFKSNQIQSKIYKSSFATEEKFKQLGNNKDLKKSASIIHLATHGFFFPDSNLTQNGSVKSRNSDLIFQFSNNPMIRSGLILAGANYAWQHGKPYKEGMEDGILTAYEISQMDLSNTELVVLSACETGLGDIQGNEGVYGLQRAFKLAGVKYLIMSLWQVSDKHTSILMTAFYKKWLDEKMTIPDAFHAAQKEMRDAGYEPYHWAGFVLVE